VGNHRCFARLLRLEDSTRERQVYLMASTSAGSPKELGAHSTSAALQ